MRGCEGSRGALAQHRCHRPTPGCAAEERLAPPAAAVPRPRPPPCQLAPGCFAAGSTGVAAATAGWEPVPPLHRLPAQHCCCCCHQAGHRTAHGPCAWRPAGGRGLAAAGAGTAERAWAAERGSRLNRCTRSTSKQSYMLHTQFDAAAPGYTGLYQFCTPSNRFACPPTLPSWLLRTPTHPAPVRQAGCAVKAGRLVGERQRQLALRHEPRRCRLAVAQAV